jgi:hypothetical protein
MSPRLLVVALVSLITVASATNGAPPVEVLGGEDGVPAAEPSAAFVEPESKPAPTTAPVTAAPRTLLEQFDAQLLALTRNEPPSESFPTLQPDDRTLLRSVIDSLASFRLTLRSSTSLTATKVAPLLELSEKIRSQIPLSLPTLALCRSVTQFGVYDPIDPPRFSAGKETPVIIYCEVEHFRSAAAAEGGGWDTKLSYEATLYSDGDHAVSVIHKKPTTIVDRCRNRRRDFFLADRMTLPGNLPVGRYVLKVTVIDQLANHVAEKNVALIVAPG